MSIHVDFCTPDSEFLASLDQIGSMSYTLSVNDFGTLAMEVPYGYIPEIGRDYQILIYRTDQPGVIRLEGETTWLVRKVRRIPAKGIMQIEAVSACQLLDRRLVLASASLTGVAETVMRQLVLNNTVLVYGREIPGVYVLATSGKGPSLSKSASNQSLLKALRDVFAATLAVGDPIYFDLVRTGLGRHEFRTYSGQRGTDHSADAAIPVVFSEARGNLIDASMEDDFTTEVTASYALGSGGASTVAINWSKIVGAPYGRTEGKRSARYASSGYLAAEANAGLYFGRAVRRIEGQAVSRDGSLYGVDWTWGDKVGIEFEDMAADAIVSKVTVSYSNGVEKAAARLSAEMAI